MKWLSRLPVTEEIAGSNPVGPAKLLMFKSPLTIEVIFCYIKCMEAHDVVELYDLLETNGIQVWLDGGWGVDALLEKQTRPHGDVDIIVQNKDVSKMVDLLSSQGFSYKVNEKWWNFVMADIIGREVDVHTVTFSENGDGAYGPQDNAKTISEPYPAASFQGTGVVGGREVKCLTADYQVISHTGYELDEDDFKDVYALHECFGVPLPEEYITE